MNNKTVIFNHIPKTAGLTLSEIMKKQYSTERTFSTLDYNGKNWEGGRRQAIKHFMDLPKFERFNFDFITGHSALELFNFVNNPIGLVMLRDPVDRVLSLYSYVRRMKWHKFYKIANQYSLYDCYKNKLHDEWDELYNGQFSSLVSTINKISFDSKIILNDDYERIKVFLKEYCLVGIVERFDESLNLFGEYLNWNKNLFYSKINVSNDKPVINPKTIEIIKKYNQNDINLYNYCSNNFDNLINSMDNKFIKKVQSFTSKNQLIMPLLVFNNQLNYYIRRIPTKLKSYLTIK